MKSKTIVDLKFSGTLNEKLVPALQKHLKSAKIGKSDDAVKAVKQLKKREDAVLQLLVSFPRRNVAMQLYLNRGEPGKFTVGIASSIGHPKTNEDFQVLQNLFLQILGAAREVNQTAVMEEIKVNM